MSPTVILASILSFICVQSTPRYIIDKYTNPLAKDGFLHYAYPFDLCVNIAAGLTDKFGVYTCNEAGTEVTKQEFGTDSECNTTAEATSTFSNTSLTAGKLYSFNCVGTDDYTVTQSYKKSASEPVPTCCENDELVVTAVTGICFEWAADNNYSMAVCDADGNGYQYKYSDSSCTTQIGDPIFAYNTECELFNENVLNLGIDVYYRSAECIVDGEELSYNVLCDDVTPSPTEPDNANVIGYITGLLIISFAWIIQ